MEKRKLGRAGIMALLLCLALAHAPLVSAQVPFNACLNREGRVIPGVLDNTIPYAGVATIKDGTPVILWNQKFNQHVSQTEQIFIYLHECAHHTLHHIYRSDYTPALELEADCWAIQLMVDGGMIKYRHLAEMEKSRRTCEAIRTTSAARRTSRALRSVWRCAPIRRHGPRHWIRSSGHPRTALPRAAAACSTPCRAWFTNRRLELRERTTAK